MQRNPLIRFISSLKLTVLALLCFCVLLIAGTIYQVDHGIYDSQQKFFNSYICMIGPVPFPGSQLVSWLMFFNLLAVLVFRFKYTLSKIPLLLVHISILFLLASSFFSQQMSFESFMTLGEGEKTNLSRDYNDWELVIKEKKDMYKPALIYDLNDLVKAKKTETEYFSLEVKEYYPNASRDPMTGLLSGLKKSTEASQNMPGLVLKLGQEATELIFSGADDDIKRYVNNDEFYFLRLVRKRYELPFSLYLEDFEKQMHPGTEVAKSYKSLVLFELEGSEDRKITISMNKPLRYKAYSVYQSSYVQDAMGNEFSTFAVVKNPARRLPYVFSLLASFGLFWFFVAKFFAFLRKGELG